MSKQGKILARTGLQVKSPEQGLLDIEVGSTLYVMNTNYMNEIKEITKHNFIYLGVDCE